MAGPFVTPKVWALREVLDAADLNTLAAEIADSINEIVDAQIAGDANISGSKILPAPNGLTGAKIENNGVRGSDLAAGVSTVAEDHDIDLSAVTLDGTWQDLANVGLTVLGGQLLVMGIVTFDITFTAQTNSFCKFRLDKGGSPLGDDFLVIPLWGRVTEVKGGAALIPYVEQVGAGAETWKIQGTKDTAVGTIVVRSAQLWAWEWR